MYIVFPEAVCFYFIKVVNLSFFLINSCVSFIPSFDLWIIVFSLGGVQKQ